MLQSISAKLAAPFLVFLAPVAFLLFLLMHAHESGIRVANNEMAGVPVIEAALGLAGAVVVFDLPEDAPSVRVAAQTALAQFDDATGRWRGARDAAAVFAAASFKARQLLDAEQPPTKRELLDIMDALVSLVRRVGDVSELVLDPEIDSYYLMDLLVNRQPATLAALLRLRLQIENNQLSELAPAEARARVAGHKQSLADLVEAMRASYSAIESNTRESGAGMRLESTLGVYLERLDWLHSRVAANADVSVLFDQALGSADLVRKSVASELILALDARIQRIKLNRNIQVLVVLALFMIAVIAMWGLIRRLVDAPLQTLTKSMLALASGETVIPGGDCGRRDEIGDMSRALMVFRDNAVRKAALELKERQSAIELEAKAAALAEAHRLGRIGNWSAKVSDDRQVWSQEIYQLLRVDPNSFVPTRRAVLDLLLPESRRRYLDAEAEQLRTKRILSMDVELVRGDGRIIDLTIVHKCELNASGEIIGFFGTFQDISERKTAERELEKLAFYDPLTGLANRALFQRRIQEAMRDTGGRPLVGGALLMLDLDRFKEVNDSLGHQAGDELLKRVTERLMRTLSADAFLARLGGDEFAAILLGADRLIARETAQAIIAALDGPIMLSMGEVSIGTSIGIALFPEDAAGADELLRRADLALYSAKDSGRARARFFEPQLSEIAQDKIMLARDLARALESSEGLHLHYQPQVDLVTSKVVGFEALIRWKHPTRGNVPPSEFIPLAESSKLICDLGLWVVREACLQLIAWDQAGHPRREVAVNVSAAQFWFSDLENDVQKVILETGAPPELLCLEVTESMFVRDAEGRVRRALEALSSLGIKLALDDFGTGYSSLGYLTKLPFHKLKIDRCFIDRVDLDTERLNLLQGIVGLGRALGMVTVAEGAERSGEVAVLEALGCDMVQGYVFGRPRPPQEAISEALAIDEGSLKAA